MNKAKKINRHAVLRNKKKLTYFILHQQLQQRTL